MELGKAYANTVKGVNSCISSEEFAVNLSSMLASVVVLRFGRTKDLYESKPRTLSSSAAIVVQTVPGKRTKDFSRV